MSDKRETIGMLMFKVIVAAGIFSVGLGYGLSLYKDTYLGVMAIERGYTQTLDRETGQVLWIAPNNYPGSLRLPLPPPPAILKFRDDSLKLRSDR
jgi:hypothetical protein